MNAIQARFSDGLNAPSPIPQDLLLIHDLVGGDLGPRVSTSSQTETHGLPVTRTTDGEEDETDSIASSSSEEEAGDVDMLIHATHLKGEGANEGADSEEEVEAGLLDGDVDGDPMTKPDSSPENSDSDTSGADTDSDDSSVIDEFNPDRMRELLESIEDEDDEGGASAIRPVIDREVANEEITVPDVAEVDEKETLERVGEILSVLQDKIVIVKGLTSEILGRAPERVLDTDTLLVFGDRKVLGYIHETFGPTHQPLYQVRFNDKFPLDKERAQILRPIFHVPNRSNFVFVDRLKLVKGSDASNAHDEEPGDDEIEFSDDEQEAAYKRMLKERRSGSRASSRAATPTVLARRDYDHVDDTFSGSSNPYDEYGAYDMNYAAGPSRPPPIPYDDPYSDSFTSVASGDTGGNIEQTTSLDDVGPSIHANSGNADSGARRHHTRGRGRGGNRNKQSERGRRGRGKGAPQHSQRHQGLAQQRGPHDYSGLDPPSGFNSPHNHQPGHGGGGEWNYTAPLVTPQPPAFGFGLQNAFPGVQPHINPRFANQLGFNFSQIPQISPGVGSLSPPSERYNPGDSGFPPMAAHHQWEEGSG